MSVRETLSSPSVVMFVNVRDNFDIEQHNIRFRHALITRDFVELVRVLWSSLLRVQFESQRAIKKVNCQFVDESYEVDGEKSIEQIDKDELKTRV